MKIPLAEHFHSLQGEGQWVGTPMHFLRLPGCSVGKKVRRGTPEDGKLFEEVVSGPVPILPSGKEAWLCHTYAGRSFWCDTDFNKYEEVELEELLKETWEEHICLTGGEPLIHREVVDEIRTRAWRQGIQVHIETSGTIDFWWEAETGSDHDCWITCSPKVGWTPYMVHHSNELKLLISPSTEDNFDPAFLAHPNVYLSPINAVEVCGDEGVMEENLSRTSLQRAQQLLRSHPNWKLSVQLHKYLDGGMR